MWQILYDILLFLRGLVVLEFSDKDLFAFVRRESEKCLKVELGQLQVIKNCAFNIVSATCAFVAKTVNDMEGNCSLNSLGFCVYSPL